MSEVKWTSSQQTAIDYHKSSVIVSAAAGSGKTAVLVERIIRMLQNTDIDKLLVVTFTQAAASQMRENIAQALEEKIRTETDDSKKELFHRQILLLPGANISTIHSFCSKIIKENFDKLGLSADYSLAEPDKSSLLLSQALEQVIEEEYDSQSSSFLNFAQNYSSYKNDQTIFEMVLTLYNFSRCVPYPEKWLDRLVYSYENIKSSDWICDFYEKAKAELTYIKNLCGKLSDELTSLTGSDREIAEKYFIPLVCDDLIQITKCDNLSNDYETAYDTFSSLKLKNFPSIRDEKIKNLPFVLSFRSKRDNIKALISEVRDKYLGFSTLQLEEFSKLQLPAIKEIVRLVKRLEETYSAKKLSSNLLDFNDLEHLAIKLLTDEDGNPTECAALLSEEFDEIIIDEYQDTNDVQETILNAISNGKSNIFMVGDMKQSIYRFRNTAPEIFLSKTESYSDDDSDTGKRVFLSSNFRSRKNILDFSNLVFSQVMSKHVGEIEYGENEQLYYGANYDGTDSAVDITVIEKNEYTDFSAIEQESAVIADKINSLIASGFLVTDKKTKKLRPVTYKDFVILLRTSKNVSDEMAAFLTKTGIPVYNDGGKELLLSSVEVQTVISYLKIIDNPYNDVALVSVLRSMFYSLSDDLLLEISKYSGKGLTFYEKLLNFKDSRTANFINDLKHYQKMASVMSVYELCDYVIQKNMLMEFSATMPGGSQRLLNLRYFLRLADNYSKNVSGGLFGFLIYIDSLSSHSQAMTSPKILPDTSDVVTITTIHKSKGLEYPIVIIPRLGKAISNLDLKSKLLIHKNIGIGFDFIDADKHMKIKSPVRRAISGKITQEHLSEELRVLYVALTRAKEKLILIGSTESHKKLIESISGAACENIHKLPPHISKSAKNYLTWILLSVLRHKSFESLFESYGYPANTVTSLSDVEINFIKNIEFADLKPENYNCEPDICEISDEIRQKLEYSVPDDGQGVFSKYSVSELKKYLENETDYKDYFEKLLPLSDTDSQGKVTYAQRGSAIHKVFELLDIKNLSTVDDIKDFVKKLTEKEILSESEADVIPCDKIFAFFTTDIGKKLKSAEIIKREIPFNIHISDKFSLCFENDFNVQLQGVIDCYFKDSDGYTIIDFKSDILSESNRSEKIKNYTKQLEFYTLALKTMHKDQPVNACIYFLDDGSVHWL